MLNQACISFKKNEEKKKKKYPQLDNSSIFKGGNG